MENLQIIGMAKASRSHQVILRNLIYKITDECDSNIVALQEPNYDDSDAKSNQPDVLVFDKENDEMMVSIEVCLKGMLNKEIKKCQQALAEYTDLKECFVIVYKSTDTYEYEILSYTKVTREEITDSDESEILDITFSDILE